MAAALLIAAPARAACPGDPKTQDWANSNPAYLQACHNVQTCPAPIPPVVVQDSDYSLHAQEVVLQATVPEGFVAKTVWWRAEYELQPGVWEVLWERKDSPQGIVPGQPGPYTVRFGAPGLMENTYHRFRVSFCDENDECWCFSSPSDPVMTTGFSGTTPVPPTSAQQMVEDHFNRPPTDPKCESGRSQGGPSTGDGLGPNAVWQDCLLNGSAYIASTKNDAEFTASSGATYARLEALHLPSYSEMLVRVKVPDGKYNLQMEGAVQPGTYYGASTMKSYAAKLDFGHRGCMRNPVLFLVKLPAEYQATKCSADGTPDPQLLLSTDDPEYIPDPGPDYALVLTEDPNQPKCDERPPLGSAAQGDTRSEPVWLRIEVGTDDEGNPKITGTVAWGNCPAEPGQDPVIENCEHVCRQTRIDTAPDTEDMWRPGTWGMSFHERDYHVDLFRAGSAQE